MGGSQGEGGSLGGTPSGLPPSFGQPCENTWSYCEGGVCTDRHVCEQCHENSDCQAGEYCEGGVCFTGSQCVNTFDCSPETICDDASDVCVYCVDDEDCPSDNTCVANYCKPNCQSDHDCRSRGELCRNDTYCAECVDHDDCPGDQYCDPFGDCRDDHCGEEETGCISDERLMCQESGQGYEFAAECRVSCALGCYPEGEQATCAATCNAWATYDYENQPTDGDCVAALDGNSYSYFSFYSFFLPECGPPGETLYSENYCDDLRVFIECTP